MRPPVAKKDPRFRPFRIAAYAVYLAVVCTFSVLVIYSVVHSVWAQTPRIPPVQGEAQTSEQCVARAQSLWTSLEAERRTFSDAKNARGLDDQWQAFRVHWLRDVREAEARCAADAPERKPLHRMFSALERLGDLYTTSATQYGGEIVPALAKFRKAVADAR